MYIYIYIYIYIYNTRSRISYLGMHNYLYASAGRIPDGSLAFSYAVVKHSLMDGRE